MWDHLKRLFGAASQTSPDNSRGAVEKANAREFSEWQLCRQAVLVVSELHAIGLERMRIIPSVAHPHAVWHCWIAPRAYVSSSHGARWGACADAIGNLSKTFPHHHGLYWSLFALSPPQRTSLSEAAKMIVSGFPEVCEQGRGADAPYVQWYRSMLASTQPDGLIFAYAEDENLDSQVAVAGYPHLKISMPPPGDD